MSYVSLNRYFSRMDVGLLQRKLSEVVFVVVDLETTGGSPKNGCAITEIGAVKIQGGVVLGEFKSFVNPLTPIPAFITELTGITNEMIAHSPIIDDVLPEFIFFCGGASETVLVAHNAPFDISFLKSAALECDIDWPDYIVFDTARIARVLLSRDEVPNCKLGTLSIFFKTEVKPTHRALDDAQTTVDVLHGLFERAGSLQLTTVESLLAKSKARKKRAPAEEYAVHWEVRAHFEEQLIREANGFD